MGQKKKPPLKTVCREKVLFGARKYFSYGPEHEKSFENRMLNVVEIPCCCEAGIASWRIAYPAQGAPKAPECVQLLPDGGREALLHVRPFRLLQHKSIECRLHSAHSSSSGPVAAGCARALSQPLAVHRACGVSVDEQKALFIYKHLIPFIHDGRAVERRRVPRLTRNIADAVTDAPGTDGARWSTQPLRLVTVELVQQALGVVGRIVAHNLLGVAHVDLVDVLAQLAAVLCLDLLDLLEPPARDKGLARVHVLGQHLGELMHEVLEDVARRICGCGCG